MLGYICKYAPVEVFESMGVKMERIEPDVTNFNQAEIRMHPNICSFAKGVLEEVMNSDYEGVILTTCCDSIRRLYDVLKEEFPDKFIYMLDTPRITKDAGITLYEQRIRTMIEEYEKFSGNTFDEEKFCGFLKGKEEEQQYAVRDNTVNIGIIGARANESIKKILAENGANVAFDLTCTGLGRKILVDETDVMTGYARGLLSQFPCMRMEQAANRDELIRRSADSVDGIIYHTVQFCDNYAYTNAVIMDQDRKIKAFSVVRTGAKSGVSADRALHEVLEKAGLKREDISWIVSTGYGRVSIEFADENVTEISCHGKGAHYFNPKIRTILDIGGQDSKAIRLSDTGEVKDFVMNDKCAAGTGRFLEMIARTLEVSLDELGAIALTSKEKIEITSMCSVFAESEVISLIANNKEKADIADGVCHAIANKASGLLRRVGMEPEFMMTEGVAKNPGVVRAVEEKIGSKLYICEEPEIVGAAGAAIYALEKMGV